MCVYHLSNHTPFRKLWCQVLRTHWGEDQAQSAAMEPDPDEHVYPGHEDIRWGSGINDKERKKGKDYCCCGGVPQL